MKSIPVFLIIVLLGVSMGCDSEAPLGPENNSSGEDMPIIVPTKAPNAASSSISNVYTFADMTEVGTSNLLRTTNGVSFELSTTQLESNTVVTLWMVIFNVPENCVDGCDINDLSNAAVETDVVYASGRVIGGSGKATYAGHRNEGDNSGSILPAWLGLPSPGLIDARKAEIHFIVHSHGPKIPGLVNEMIHSFNAGCGPVFDPTLPDVPEELGTYGPNTCEDIQFAVHTP